MVYLEREIKQDDGQVGEFLYSREYIDYDFYTSQARSSQESQNIVAPDLYDDFKERQKKLDVLLASQSWRKGIFDDTDALTKKIRKAKGDDKILHENLWGKKVQE